MSLVQHLLDSRDKLELAKELAEMAKRNAKLENKVHELEHALWWTKAITRQKDQE